MQVGKELWGYNWATLLKINTSEKLWRLYQVLSLHNNCNLLSDYIVYLCRYRPSVCATVMSVLMQSTFLAFISVSGELAVSNVNRARHCTNASRSICTPTGGTALGSKVGLPSTGSRYTESWNVESQPTGTEQAQRPVHLALKGHGLECHGKKDIIKMSRRCKAGREWEHPISQKTLTHWTKKRENIWRQKTARSSNIFQKYLKFKIFKLRSLTARRRKQNNEYQRTTSNRVAKNIISLPFVIIFLTKRLNITTAHLDIITCLLNAQNLLCITKECEKLWSSLAHHYVTP